MLSLWRRDTHHSLHSEIELVYRLDFSQVQQARGAEMDIVSVGIDAMFRTSNNLNSASIL